MSRHSEAIDRWKEAEDYSAEMLLCSLMDGPDGDYFTEEWKRAVKAEEQAERDSIAVLMEDVLDEDIIVTDDNGRLISKSEVINHMRGVYRDGC